MTGEVAREARFSFLSSPISAAVGYNKTFRGTSDVKRRGCFLPHPPPAEHHRVLNLPDTGITWSRPLPFLCFSVFRGAGMIALSGGNRVRAMG